jgi:hypothetical protein
LCAAVLSHLVAAHQSSFIASSTAYNSKQEGIEFEYFRSSNLDEAMVAVEGVPVFVHVPLQVQVQVLEHKVQAAGGCVGNTSIGAVKFLSIPD